MNKKITIGATGFTLLEILVAVFILAIIISIIFSSYTGTFRITEETEFQAKIYQMARIALERIQEDLECGSPLSKGAPAEIEGSPSEDAAMSAGFLGENEEIDGRYADSLTFLSTKHILMGKEDRHSGLTRIAFYVIENNDGESFTLYRSETLEFVNAPEEKTGGVILCDGLFSVNFVYYNSDGDQYDGWDTSEDEFMGKLPARVSIQLEFLNGPHSETPLKFSTGVALPMARDIYGVIAGLT